MAPLASGAVLHFPCSGLSHRAAGATQDSAQYQANMRKSAHEDGFPTEVEGAVSGRWRKAELSLPSINGMNELFH